MRDIKFNFDAEKALHAMAYVVRALGHVEKVKLMKLLYIADKEHFLEHGYPIAGDSQSAMPHGPVPSNTLDVLNGESLQDVFAILHQDDNTITLRHYPDKSRLTEDDERTLDRVLVEHGGKQTWTLRNETHEYPEYKEVYVEGSSRRIPYELMLKHSGDERHFRHGRPVISAGTVERMTCPFAPGEDADL